MKFTPEPSQNITTKLLENHNHKFRRRDGESFPMKDAFLAILVRRLFGNINTRTFEALRGGFSNSPINPSRLQKQQVQLLIPIIFRR